MDDVIIIILTIVLTIIAAVNQSKKKKQQQQSPGTPEPDFWETILGGETTGIPGEPAKVNIPSEEILRTQPHPAMKKNIPGKSAGIKKSAAAQRHMGYQEEGGRNEDILQRSLKNTAALESALQEDSESILEEFSVRKAIIYSEIINPKYF